MNKLISKTFTAGILIFVLTSFRIDQGFKPGDKTLDFNLKNIDGKMISSASFPESKGFILIFTCNHCPFSKAYENRIIKLDNTFKPKGYPVIAINSNDPKVSPEDSFELMQERAKDKKFPFPYLFDETQEIAQAYGATHTPHVFLVKKEKKDLILKYAGAIDNNTDDESAATAHYVADAVNELLGEKSVSIPETKSVGCSIKWKK